MRSDDPLHSNNPIETEANQRHKMSLMCSPNSKHILEDQEQIKEKSQENIKNPDENHYVSLLDDLIQKSEDILQLSSSHHSPKYNQMNSSSQ